MKNLGHVMRMVQQAQEHAQRMQEELATVEVGGSSGAGLIQVTMSGKGELKRVRIDPTLFDREEVGVVEDLLVAAVNDARAKVDQRMSEEMSKLTGGLPLPPGFKLPF